MVGVIQRWVQRYISDPQAVLLLLLLGGGVLLFMYMGHILAPLIVSIIIAYLLRSPVNALTQWGMPSLAAVLLVFSGFLGLFLVSILILLPIVWQQTRRLIQEFPSMINGFQAFLDVLPEKFPQFLTPETVQKGIATFLAQLKHMGSALLTASLESLPTLAAVMVYVVLVPLMVFFLLKDHQVILRWVLGFLPTNRPLLARVWNEVDLQIGNYIRGKVAEVVIVGVATYFVFYLFGMSYAALLAVLVGISVFIPYVGAVAVTIPVVLVAFFQWGLGAKFAYLMAAYGILQVIDGTVLSTLLFSGTVNLHPIAIIGAVLVFGGWWGFWGIFFAIPLAALVKAVIAAWPRVIPEQERII